MKYFKGQYRIVVRFPINPIKRADRVEASITNTRYKDTVIFKAPTIKGAIRKCADWTVMF